MKYCPNCGCPVTPPSHEGDDCYSCGEAIGLWFKEETYEESGMPDVDWLHWIMAGALLTTVCIWFSK